MNDKEIEDAGKDTSASVTFNLSITVENGRLDEASRRRVASVISRAAGTMSLSLDRIVEGRYHTGLSKRSSAMGYVELDAGMADET